MYFLSPQWVHRLLSASKTLTPEIFFPKLLSYLREFFFQKSAARTFVRVYEFADLRVRMSLEQDMYMVFVVVPLLQCDIVIQRYVLKYLFSPVGNFIIEHLPPIFYNKYKMIVQQKYRMCIVV